MSEETLEVKYVPTVIHCVWVVDRNDKSVSFIGQLPRDGLREEDLALEDWVYAERDYLDVRPSERIYDVRFGTIEEYMAQWFAYKSVKGSFKIAGLEVY